MLQYAGKVREKEDCLLINVDENNGEFKRIQHLLELKDTHNAFRWETLNVNLTYICLQQISTGHL